ncbi:serine hydrolase domain-containing protein [Flagellimonas sp. S174]|uniref:serine hydrolase domain-containing protein n=1 Tax=Flagellimonas sp. S174 TaxID=3410790 RepID=UPI003BF5C7E7
MSGWFNFLKHLFSEKIGKPKGTGTSQLDFVIQNLVRAKQIPGVAVSIWKGGERILEKGYGFESLETKKSIDPRRSVFRIASISKCITGLALGKMMEEGLMHWDASFYEYVPDYPQKKYDFTIRQLASHTAGIRAYRGKEFALNEPYSIEQSIEIFKNDPLLFEPGKGYLYNSFDFVLLSLAMQEASGIPFEQYVREKILYPLEMNNTLAREKEELSFRAEREISISEFYTRTSTGFRKAVDVNNFYKLAGGGYLSTSDDIAKLGQAILKGSLLSEGTYKELFTAQKVDSESTYYGLGFQVSQDVAGRHYIGHVGNSVGAYTNFFVYPGEKMIISILINCTNPKIQMDLDNGIQKLFMNFT